MPSSEADPVQSSNITPKRQPGKRKREAPGSRLASNKSSRLDTPNAYARRSPPRSVDPPPIEDDEEEAGRSPPQKLKRPGAGARLGAASRGAAEASRRKREEEARAEVVGRQTTNADVVASHYNAVPERGRQWRKTDSQIKGLRSLNNWIKSTLIQKFSQPEFPSEHGMTVLDMACGKGGDLGKWEKAPTVPALYVGCDIADVSVDQAKKRYHESLRKRANRQNRPAQMKAEFYVKDTFGTSLGEIPIVRQVGFNPNAGPGPGLIHGGMTSGGFDVVSMMFALHYSFESEALARGMLRNVAGALKKGGRFIGVMPNSDLITASVKRLMHAESSGATPNGNIATPLVSTGQTRDETDDDWDPEKSLDPTKENNSDGDDDWDPERPSEPQTSGDAFGLQDNENDDWDPEKPSEPATTSVSAEGELDQLNSQATPANPTPLHVLTETTSLPPLQWGNSIYNVRFPRSQPLTQRPLPRDGIFRPPFGWKYHYSLEEAVDTPEYVVPWEAFRALAEDYGLELLYRKGFKEVFEDESGDHELGMLAERMGVVSGDLREGKRGLLVSDEEMGAAGFYHAFCFYKT